MAYKDSGESKAYERARGFQDYLTEIIVIIIFLVYLLGIYLLIRRLYRELQVDQERLYKEENQRKNELFKGLARDMKTPLSSVIGYSKALKDGLIE